MIHKKTILIVDDVPDNVEVIGEALDGSYNVQFAFNGAEALELVNDHLPDLILLDVMMPGMDGYEVLVHLKGQIRTRGIPVIFITAKNDSESESGALSAGAADFLHKPINPDVLRSRIALHLSLRDQQLQLEASNASLEIAVADRTRELEHLVQDLTLAKEAAELANQAKTVFLSTMSHELKTPMNAIIGFSSLLARSLSDPKQQEKVKKILLAGNSLLQLLNQILDYAKIESSRLTLEESPFPFGSLVEHLETDFRDQAIAKGLEFSTELSDKLRAQYVWGDLLRLQQILRNLVANAIKFTDNGFVRITIETLAETSRDISFQITILDSGLGVSRDVQRRIFSPFEQADNSMTRRFGGAGLGLSISKQLLDLMGGTLTLNSVPGEGSQFVCSLTLKKASELQ